MRKNIYTCINIEKEREKKKEFKKKRYINNIINFDYQKYIYVITHTHSTSIADCQNYTQKEVVFG